MSWEPKYYLDTLTHFRKVKKLRNCYSILYSVYTDLLSDFNKLLKEHQRLLEEKDSALADAERAWKRVKKLEVRINAVRGDK